MVKIFSVAILLTLLPILLFCGQGLIANRGPEVVDWKTIQWPFPVDAWPEGRAFHCGRDDCGMEVDFYIRPKIGFCDCYRGVADDDEIDRVGDIAVLSQSYTPLGPGTAVSLGGIQGRARHFAVSLPNHAKLYATGIALSRRCDAIVAMLVGDGPLSDRAEESAFRLLNSPEIKTWIETLPQS